MMDRGSGRTANPEIGEIRSYQVPPGLAGPSSLSAQKREALGKYAFYRLCGKK
jgi:hypothetical protein